MSFRRSATPEDDVESADWQQKNVSPSHSNASGDDDQDGEDDIDRNSNMWIAAAFNITAIIGVGVLSLPYAMVFLQWSGGPVVVVLAFFITYFTMRQLIELHEFEFVNLGKRYGTYRDLGQRAFGYGKGLWIILPLQLVVEVSLDILFTVAAGEAMNRIYDTPGDQCKPVPLFVWFAVFAAIQIGLSIVIPTFESLTWIAIPAAIMSICYSTIAWSIVVSHPDRLPPKYTFPNSTILVDHYYNTSAPLPKWLISEYKNLTTKDDIFEVFNAIGVVAFAYAAHNVVLEIQNGIPIQSKSPASIPGESPEIPRKSKRLRQNTSIPEMMRGVWITYAVVAVCYFPMAFAVYHVYGNQMSPNVLSFIQYRLVKKAPRGLIVATNIMLIIHLIGSYQIFAMPVFKQLQTWSLKIRFIHNPLWINYTKYIIRFSYIVFTTILAMIFPYFSPLLGFFGGLAIAPTTYFLPCVIYLRLKKPERWSLEWCLNWAFIILGVLLMILATIGGGYLLIKESEEDTYVLWSKKWRTSTFYAFTSSNCKKPV